MIPFDFNTSTLGGKERDFTIFRAWDDSTRGILTRGEAVDIYCSEVGTLNVVLEGAATAKDYYRLIRLIGDPKDIKITVLEKYSRVEVLPSLIPIVDSKSSIADLGYKAKITVGGKDKTKFAPNINASFTRKVADEFFLNINDRKQLIGKEAPALSDNLAEIKAGGRTSRYYVKEDGTLEYEIVLDAPPPEGYIELEILCKGLTFEHQPELTPKELAAGDTRDEDRINGYDIFCSKSNNDYQNGMVGYLKRSSVLDIFGKREWTTQSIAIKNGVGLWRINVPTDPARYPLTVGPTLGFVSFGSSRKAVINRDTWAIFADLGSVVGQITKITAAAEDTAVNPHKFGIYEDDGVGPSNLLAQVAGDFHDKTWASGPLSYLMTGPARFWLAVQVNAVEYFRYSIVAGYNPEHVKPATFVLTDPWAGSDPGAYDQRLAIWVDYDEVHAPDAPTNPTPADTATDIASGDVTLECDVTDDDGDAMDVSFYDASDDSLIGTDAGVASGGTATVAWTGRAAGTAYTWYAKASDGTLITTGPDWTFTTASAGGVKRSLTHMKMGLAL